MRMRVSFTAYDPKVLEIFSHLLVDVLHEDYQGNYSQVATRLHQLVEDVSQSQYHRLYSQQLEELRSFCKSTFGDPPSS